MLKLRNNLSLFLRNTIRTGYSNRGPFRAMSSQKVMSSRTEVMNNAKRKTLQDDSIFDSMSFSESVSQKKPKLELFGHAEDNVEYRGNRIANVLDGLEEMSNLEEDCLKLISVLDRMESKYPDHGKMFTESRNIIVKYLEEIPILATKSDFTANDHVPIVSDTETSGPIKVTKQLKNLFTSTQKEEEIAQNIDKKEDFVIEQSVEFKVPSSPVKLNVDLRPCSSSKNIANEDTDIIRIDQKRFAHHQADNKLELTEQMTVKKEKKVEEPVAITLSKEQESVIQLAKEGYNLFYTGAAGTGKSLLLRTLVKELKQQYGDNPLAVGVTASTGLAAYNIGGMTINSYTGIGLGEGSAAEINRKLKRNTNALERWDGLQVLIIDEVSMIDGRLLDKLDQLARLRKRSKKPFGGVQVILCGDFYQLPPVSRDSSMKFAFESEFWKKHIKVQVMLTTVYRQKTDLQFLQMLEEIRSGNVSESTVKRFKPLQNPRDVPFPPTHLFSTRREVDEANSRRLKELKGPSITFTAVDTGSLANKPQGKKMLESFLAPQVLVLKPYAQVMLIKNIDSTLVNGSMGTVIGFLNNATFQSYAKLLDEPVEGSYKTYQYFDTREPTDSIFDFIEKSKAKIEETLKKEQLSLSKLTSVADSIEGTDESYNETNNELLDNLNRKIQLIRDLERSDIGGKVIPIINFKLADRTSRIVALNYERFTIDDHRGVPMVERKQVPLMLAWALSIHKAQGQTLKHVIVDLKRIFEDGQAYVALSRAEHRRGLQVLNFNGEKIRTNPKVIHFYKTLEDVETVRAKISTNTLLETPDNSFDPSVPVGPQTQLKHLNELSATPERFTKKPLYQSRKQSNACLKVQKSNSIDDLLRQQAIRASQEAPSVRTPEITNEIGRTEDREDEVLNFNFMGDCLSDDELNEVSKEFFNP